MNKQDHFQIPKRKKKKGNPDILICFQNQYQQYYKGIEARCESYTVFTEKVSASYVKKRIMVLLKLQQLIQQFYEWPSMKLDPTQALKLHY